MKKLPAVIFLAIGGVALGVGCVDNDVSLFIYNVQGAKLVQSEEENVYYCVWDSGDEPAPCQRGLLDVANSYWTSTPEGSPFLTLYFFVVNGLPTNVDVTRGQLNTHDVRVERVEARYRWLGDRETIEKDTNLAPLLALEQSSAVAVQFVAENLLPAAAADGTSFSIGLLQARVIPAEIGSVLAQTMQGQPVATLAKIALGVQVRLIGSTTGGQHVESADFSFPVSICSECLEDASGNPLLGCFPGQDPYTTTCFQAQ